MPICNDKQSDTCLNAYHAQYPKDSCCFGEPSGHCLIGYGKKQEKTVIEPEGETVATFLDRLERSKKSGRNLFYEEWEPFEYDPDLIY